MAEGGWEKGGWARRLLRVDRRTRCDIKTRQKKKQKKVGKKL